VPYLEVMKQFLQINDNFFELRIEWIFGIAEVYIKTDY